MDEDFDLLALDEEEFFLLFEDEDDEVEVADDGEFDFDAFMGDSGWDADPEA